MSAAASSIPVIVLSGFLGAGKSTLLNALLSQSPMADTAVVVNEFGEIAIDHDLIRTDRREIMITTAGCLCCTASSDIRGSLFDLHQAVVAGLARPFARVVVETTGLADPAPIVNQLIRGYAPPKCLRDHVIASCFHLAGFVCAADATALTTTVEQHFECLKQIAFADRIILTKTDLDGDKAALTALLQQINPAADIVDRNATPFDLASLFAPRGYASIARSKDVDGWLALDRTLASGHDHAQQAGQPRHDARIRTIALTHDNLVNASDLQAFLGALKLVAGERLLRLKGLVGVADDPDHPYVLHAVQHIVHPPQRLTQWPSPDRRTRLVLITHDIDADTIKKLFDALTRLPGRSTPALAEPIAGIHRSADGLADEVHRP